MEPEQSSKLPPIYVSKRKTVRTDMLTRQALIPPIFRKKDQPKRDPKYLKVHSANSTGNDALSSSLETCRQELYIKYSTDFNYLSPELLLNKKTAEVNDVCQLSLRNENDQRAAPKRSRDELDTDSNKTTEKRRKSKYAFSDGPCYVPKSPWLNRVLPLLMRLFPHKDAGSDDSSKDEVKLDIVNLYKTRKQVEEDTLREAANVLSNAVTSIDDWRNKVIEATAQKITIEEARSLMDDFRELSGGIIKVALATEMDNDIKTCEAFGAKVRMTMTILSSSAERMVSLEELESLMQEAKKCRFLVPEVVALQSIFRNLVSIRSLMESSVIDLDLSECESLAAACEKGIVRIPRLDELRKHLQESVWLHSATRVCQRPVKYSLARSLVGSVPEALKGHKLYACIKKKCTGVEKWVECISQYSFFKALTGDNIKGLILKKETTGKEAPLTNGATEKRCDAKTFEELCITYQNLELTLPFYRSIEPIYQSLRRLQRRLNKIENMINSNSRSPNIATDCIWLLQHSEPLSEYLDLTEYLQPIRTGVELWLNYEKKCRKALDSIKSFTLSKDFSRLKTDWNFLLNFRKTTKLTDEDLSAIVELMKVYEGEGRIDFAEVQELETEFGCLRIKNLVLQREISEINEKGVNLISKVETALDNVKSDNCKSESVLTHVVMVVLEVLKFGAKMDCMPTLLVCMEYLRWSRSFYSLLLRNDALADGGENLRTLARDGMQDEFKSFTEHITLHKDIIDHVNSLSSSYNTGSGDIKEYELLTLFLS